MENSVFKFHFLKLLLRNYVVDFVEICNVCVRKAIIEAAKRIINSNKVCRSYSDLNFGVTSLEHSVYGQNRPKQQSHCLFATAKLFVSVLCRQTPPPPYTNRLIDIQIIRH